MTTAVVNVKVNPTLKREAKKVAENLGFSLSGVVNAYLKQLVRTKKVDFSLVSEIPSAYMTKAMREAEQDVKAGRMVSFKSGKDALTYLDKMIAYEPKSRKTK